MVQAFPSVASIMAGIIASNPGDHRCSICVWFIVADILGLKERSLVSHGNIGSCLCNCERDVH